MSLEQRVQVVEMELELLKAQIQTTLLNIQEHLLNNTYTALRTQEAPVKVTMQPALEEVRTPAANPALKKFSAVNPKPQPTIDVDQVFERIPPARNVVRLDEDARFDPAPEPVIEQRDLDEAEEEAIASTWMQLDKWVSQKVRELGLERTRELINLYGGKERELLLRVVDVYDQNDRRSGRAPIPYGEPNYERQSRPQPMQSVAEEWQRHANNNKSKNAPSSNARPFGDHQELVLRLIADILNSREEPSVAAGNGYMKH